MKNRLALVAVFALSLTGVQGAWGQWSSNPAVNLPLSDMVNADQVQPKIRPLPDGQWYVSWFNSDANDAPPIGYDVYYQRLSPGGVEKFAHDGARIATLSNSSTEDYGLDIDTNGNALLAFLDTRESANQQVTAVKMDKQGHPLWGRYGVQLTKGSNGHYSPRITGTTDGGVVVAWTEVGNSTAQVMIQKLDHNGHLLWPSPVVLQATGVNYNLADLHAADNGSVIISWEFDTGFFGNKQLATNKLSSGGKRLWGANNVVLFNVGSLQFGEFPYFILDGSGGAVFAWYTAYPTLQVFAQHIYGRTAQRRFRRAGPRVRSTSTRSTWSRRSRTGRQATKRFFSGPKKTATSFITVCQGKSSTETACRSGLRLGSWLCLSALSLKPRPL
jgi:hypothetical protein